LVQETLKAMTEQVMQRRAFIRAVLEGATVPDPAADCHWISLAWLNKWADSAEPPPPIDNAPLLCSHNTLDPTKVAGELG
jgi:hypothetical protein